MNDRQLLEAAAKAAGLVIQRSRLDDPMHKDFLIVGSGLRNPGQKAFPWNALADDGDALRLAVKLKIPLQFPDFQDIARTWSAKDDLEEYIEPAMNHNGDLAAATRRAIVRAAAQTGLAREGEGKKE